MVLPPEAITVVPQVGAITEARVLQEVPEVLMVEDEVEEDKRNEK